MLHEKASMTGEPVKKLFPIPNPKNWEYQSKPAKAQNNKLLTPVDTDTEKYSDRKSVV